MTIQLQSADLTQAKEKSLDIFGQQGHKLEAIFNGAPSAIEGKPYLAIVGHPHSLHGGTMNNKVVTTIVRSLKEEGIPSLRFNFRGVEGSEGQFARGIGESDDLLHIRSQLLELFPEHKIILAGFSFGAYVTYRAACQSETELLISVAPAVNHGDFCEFASFPSSWHVLVADADEIVPLDDVLNWHSKVEPSPKLHRFPATSHFFHGQLVTLRQTLKDILQTR